MKIKLRIASFLLFVLCAGVQLCAEQIDTNSISSIRAKAESGDAHSQSILGWKYEYGVGVNQDYAEATKWYRLAAEQGDTASEYNLGAMYAHGVGVSQSYDEAAKLLRKAAEQGLAVAQKDFGLCYLQGLGVVKDSTEGIKWLSKAAEQGYSEAQYSLGFYYYNGKKLTNDLAEAVKWFRKAAEQNHALAQTMLAQCYENGEGLTNDDVEAVKWFRKAAEQNDAWAQFKLGGHYYLGKGVPQNDNEAVNWTRKAAEQNEPKAQYCLGAYYSEGIGLPKDYLEAVKWWRKAAEQNHPDAQYDLGRCYCYGEGVPKDYLQGYKWLNLASAQGKDAAKKLLPIVEANMTPSQIAEAQQLSSSFIPNKNFVSDNTTSPANPTFTGTGFFITDDGYLISNYHVVKGAAKVRLLTGAGLIDASVVKVDAANDLALLKAVGRFAPLPIAASRTVKLGGTVATVGFPDIGLQGFAPKLAKGEIASLAGAADDPRYFQISLPVQPGNSGGALVDARGNVVGIVAAKLSAKAALDATGQLPENVNYAVKSSLLLSFLESVPDVAAKLKDPKSLQTATPPFEDVVKSAQDAAVLVLVY